MDILTFIAELAKALSWPTSVLAIILLLRKPLAQKLGELIEIHGEGKSFRALFAGQQKAPATLPDPGQSIMTQEEVKEALIRVPLLKKVDVERDFVRAHAQFLRGGVVTKRQLEQVLGSGEILAILKDLYVTELIRPSDTPLDPFGLAVFGSILYSFGTDPYVIHMIREQIRQSPEYKQKH